MALRLGPKVKAAIEAGVVAYAPTKESLQEHRDRCINMIRKGFVTIMLDPMQVLAMVEWIDKRMGEDSEGMDH